ncbi:hypothetical protein, partial [Psychroserpens sp.]|uniref:hypothetical protein n=1 Tax=Psychroserpens sp. TaxID=2020870 RepID=UPI003C75FD97
MISKATLNIKMLNHLKWVAFIFLMIQANVIAQTVTNVLPSRITTKSTVSIVGTNFSPSTTVSVSGISTNNITFVSSGEITLEITQTGTNDITGTINVDGSSSAFTIEYIAPTQKTLRNGTSSNVTKITEIFTTYDGFWRSSQWKADPTNNSLKPNTNHDLLAFTYDGVTYSTGVDDALLTSNGVAFSPQLFFAYTTNGVDGVTQPNNYLATGDLVDGEVGEGTTITSPEILGTTVYDAIIDGVNGLDIGTGITNFNQTAEVEFFSAGGQLGALNDVIPDFLISQIAMAGSTDVYFYADADKNVVGRPVRLTINEESDDAGDALLARWRLDLYRFLNGVNYGIATPTSRAFSDNEQRPLRMVALRFEDFAIDDTNIDDINNINMVAGGTADLAFLAYNRGSFDIKTPVFSQFPISRFVCKLPSSSDVTLSAMAEVSGGSTGAPEETLSYQWFKFNNAIPGATSSSYTITDDIDMATLGTYKLRVSNDFGAVVSSVSLSQGGTPTFWNGSEWQLPPVYQDAGIVLNDEDRGLIFSADYNETGDLEGCDCLVPNGSDVTISSGSTLKLVGAVTVESGATLTLSDSANLIQTKEVSSNENIGAIRVERDANGIVSEDVLFWSSPVANYNVSNITDPFTTSAFLWDVNATNSNGILGEWVPTSGNMTTAAGYAVNVPTDYVTAGFTATFQGKPQNGSYAIDVFKSVGSNQPTVERRHWNLLGNPYPSAINAEAFLDANPLLEGHIRLWSNNTEISNVSSPLSSAAYQSLNYGYGESYVTYNFTGSNPPATSEGFIASGQGFYVQIDDAEAAGSVIFEN